MGSLKRLAANRHVDLLRWVASTYLRPQLRPMLWAAMWMAVSAASLAALTWLVQPALNQVISDPTSSLIYLIPVGVVLILAINGMALYASQLLTAEVGQGLILSMQSDLFRHYLTADQALLNRTHTGMMISVSVADTGLLLTALTNLLLGIARDLVMFIFLAAVMFTQNWQLAFATMIVLPMLAIAIRAVGRRVRSRTDAWLNETLRLTTLMTEAFNAIRLVKISATEAFESDRHARTIGRRSKAFLRVIRRKALMQPINEITTGIAIALVIAYGISQAAAGAEAFSRLASFLVALMFAYRPIKRIAIVMADFQEGMVAAHRIRSILDQKPEVVDRPGAPMLAVARGDIAFADVTFGYEPGAPVVRNLTLTVPAGRKVALVGPSGGGKTTLLSLIPRLYELDDGRITIDGQDIAGVTLASLRAAIAVVSQEVMLFDDTVRANIAYGRPQASEAEIVAAAEAAAADEFIRALPQGYDTPVGERGMRLSGGQRQRLAIARALLRNAPILLLDEPTSALDADAELAIKDALSRLMRNRTTLIVAHRLSTIADADEIHVLVHGRIVESGRHDQLIAKGGVYARLYAIQSFEASLEALTEEAPASPEFPKLVSAGG